MGDEPVGQAGQRGADLAEQRLGNRRPAALVPAGIGRQVRPATVQPVRLVGAKAAAGLELVAQMRLERRLDPVDLALGDQIVGTSLSV
jgi:hypothetical protein